MIKKAAASSNRVNKKSHHSTNQKFEDNYYYYYYGNTHQLTSKNNLKTKPPKSSNDLDSSTKDSNEEANLAPVQLKKSLKNDHSSRNQQKNKISKMLKKFNKKGSNSQQEDIAEAFEKLANLKKVSNFKKTSIDANNEFQYHEMEETAISHNSDNKENYKKEIDTNFKPYTQNVILHIQIKTIETSINQTKSIPVHIEVLTSIWCEKISRKVI